MSTTNALTAPLRLVIMALAFAVPVWADAQQPAQDTTHKAPARGDSARADTSRVPAPARVVAPMRPVASAPSIDTLGPRPELRPPLSPKKAFLYSLMLPGYSQSVLGRNRAGAIEMAFEAVALSMVRISAADVREARRFMADSVPVSYVDDAGGPQVLYQRTIYTPALLRSRRAHLEDWIAVLVGNHLFSAADAFVAANLWDLPTEVSLRATPRGADVALTVPW